MTTPSTGGGSNALTRWDIAFLSIVFLAGLALRLRPALTIYMNPDEALQALLAFTQPGEGWVQIWRNSLTVAHPPLLILLTHAVSLISKTEIAMRMISILSGSLFPIFLFVWLRRLTGKTAALAVMFLLTMAPNLITISAQLRSYTLALFFLSAALVTLDWAIETGRVWMIWMFNALLWACIFSDFSMVWFACAAGVYALVRLRGSTVAIKVAWAAGQALAVGLYGLLFLEGVQVPHLAGFRSAAVTGWLQQDFPEPGHKLVFPFVNTLDQFSYLTGSRTLGAVALGMFAIAVVLLWTGRAGMQREKSRAVAMLVILPFVLLMAAAYIGVFPYGGTRHTLVAGLFGGVGMAIFIGLWNPRVATGALWGGLLLTPLWYRFGRVPDSEDISASRNSREMMLQCIQYMRQAIPPDTLIFTERGTLLVLAYYEGDPLPPESVPTFAESRLAGRWRAATRDYVYAAKEQYDGAMTAFRVRYGIPTPTPWFWVLDGGLSAVSAPEDPVRPFTRVLRVFQSESP